MASNNLQKIVQNNFHLNPWVLSKNTNEIVNTCIQKIYKQVPQSFKKDLKPPRIAAPRPENKAPIRCFQTQQRGQASAKIVPQSSTHTAKKSFRSNASHSKLSQDRSKAFWGAGNKHKLQIKRENSAAFAESNKKFLKSPNFKIYGSRRFGSSASSSRSSIFRRHDERRRQKQPYATQLKSLVRSFHSGGFSESLAKYLMPSRNQKVKGNLGSLPEAIKISSSIQNDLMIINDAIRNRISVGGGRARVQGKPINESFANVDRLQVWKHPPPLDKFRFNTLNELLGKSNTKASYRRTSQQSPEHRDFGKYKAAPLMHFRHPSPLDELVAVQHMRQKTASQEQHRRNRMKKLGLIQDSPRPSATLMAKRAQAKLLECGSVCVQDNKLKQSIQSREPTHNDHKSKLMPKSSQKDACRQPYDLNGHQKSSNNFPMAKPKNVLLEKVTACGTRKEPKELEDSGLPRPCSDQCESVHTSSPISDRLCGPLALATANLKRPLVGNLNGYRSKHYSLKKY